MYKIIKISKSNIAGVTIDHASTEKLASERAKQYNLIRKENEMILTREEK